MPSHSKGQPQWPIVDLTVFHAPSIAAVSFSMNRKSLTMGREATYIHTDIPVIL